MIRKNSGNFNSPTFISMLPKVSSEADAVNCNKILNHIFRAAQSIGERATLAMIKYALSL